MPGILKNKDSEGMSQAVQTASPANPGTSDTEIMPQPRQPTSLHGLLRFAMEATKSEDAPSTSSFTSMDSEVSLQ